MTFASWYVAVRGAQGGATRGGTGDEAQGRAGEGGAGGGEDVAGEGRAGKGGTMVNPAFLPAHVERAKCRAYVEHDDAAQLHRDVLHDNVSGAAAEVLAKLAALVEDDWSAREALHDLVALRRRRLLLLEAAALLLFRLFLCEEKVPIKEKGRGLQ